MKRPLSPRLSHIDFAALHREQCRLSSFGPRSSADWDLRAKERTPHRKDTDYDRAFLAHMDLSGVATALDIGCGTGNLSIPLARRLRHVHALDFSPAMLDLLERNRRRARLNNITVHRLSWTDSWITVPQADIVVCSRALGVEDLHGALSKLVRHARLRAYVSLHATGHFLREDVAALLDRLIHPRPDYIFAVNLLYQMGIRASVHFIHSSGTTSYPTSRHFLDAIRWRVGPLSLKEENRLRRFYRNLPATPDGSAQFPHDFQWALLSWDTPR